MSTGTTPAIKTKLDLPFAEAVDKVTEALQQQGFGILTEIDVKATMKKKLDVDFQPYVILGACNPPLAHRALTADLEIGLLMPCNVIVYEEGSGSVVSIGDPSLMAQIAGGGELEEVAAEARSRLVAVLESLDS